MALEREAKGGAPRASRIGPSADRARKLISTRIGMVRSMSASRSNYDLPAPGSVDQVVLPYDGLS